MRVSTDKLFYFSSASVPVLPVLSPCLPSTHPLINNGAIGDRALFCHLTFPPPTQRQTAGDASSGTDYSWSAICMKKTSMAAAALLDSIIQLSPVL